MYFINFLMKLDMQINNIPDSYQFLILSLIKIKPFISLNIPTVATWEFPILSEAVISIKSYRSYRK
jgi:hypothetical protein